LVPVYFVMDPSDLLALPAALVAPWLMRRSQNLGAIFAPALSKTQRFRALNMGGPGIAGKSPWHVNCI
jgi:hypothetical protein